MPHLLPTHSWKQAFDSRSRKALYWRLLKAEQSSARSASKEISCFCKPAGHHPCSVGTAGSFPWHQDNLPTKNNSAVPAKSGFRVSSQVALGGKLPKIVLRTIT